jgi:PAS domain-containing protein
MNTEGAARARRNEHDADLDAWPEQIVYLLRELDDARSQLADSIETLRGISYGGIGAQAMTADAGGEHTITLPSEDRLFRSFVETMADGAVTVSPDGVVLYANRLSLIWLRSRASGSSGVQYLSSSARRVARGSPT